MSTYTQRAERMREQARAEDERAWSRAMQDPDLRDHYQQDRIERAHAALDEAATEHDDPEWQAAVVASRAKLPAR